MIVFLIFSYEVTGRFLFVKSHIGSISAMQKIV